MYHFDYVSKKEAAPYKAGLIELLNKVQDYVRDEFTFQFTLSTIAFSRASSASLK